MFSETMLETVQPTDWWRYIKLKQQKVVNKLPDGFCDFFISLHCCPASSGSIERIFSTFGLVWDKMRNKLGAQKALKLVQLYRQLKVEPENEDEF